MKTVKINFDKKNLNKEILSVKETFKNAINLEYELDLSKLNLIDASKTILLLSTELMKKNTKSKINCFLKDNETLDIIAPRKLKNTFLSVTLNDNRVREFQYKNNIGIKSRKRYC